MIRRGECQIGTSHMPAFVTNHFEGMEGTIMDEVASYE
jgi:hypothetical protein